MILISYRFWKPVLSKFYQQYGQYKDEEVLFFTSPLEQNRIECFFIFSNSCIIISYWSESEENLKNKIWLFVMSQAFEDRIIFLSIIDNMPWLYNFVTFRIFFLNRESV